MITCEILGNVQLNTNLRIRSLYFIGNKCHHRLINISTIIHNLTMQFPFCFSDGELKNTKIGFQQTQFTKFTILPVAIWVS